jgi:hypothetical protein
MTITRFPTWIVEHESKNPGLAGLMVRLTVGFPAEAQQT